MSNADWWAKKLGQQPQPPVGRPDPTPAMPPSQQPMAVMPTFQPQTQSAAAKAQSARSTASCPDCGSSNYFSATPQTTQRCYDCGYPLQQSGSRYGGLAGAHIEGATKQATGNDATNHWNPTEIIAKVE